MLEFMRGKGSRGEYCSIVKRKKHKIKTGTPHEALCKALHNASCPLSSIRFFI